MKKFFTDFLTFLVDSWWVWLGVMLVTTGLLVWLAKTGGTPDSPFTYRV